MFGLTWHDIIAGMAGNGAWLVVISVLALFWRRMSASIKSDGVGRTATRGLWSALLLATAGGSLAFALYLYHGRGFNNGVWFVVSCSNCWTYLRAFTSFNRNWLSPAMDKLAGGASHIFEIAHPDHKPGLPVPAPDVRALIEQMDVTIMTIEGYRAISNVVDVGKDAVEPLIEALHHRRQWVRANAAYALGDINDERAIPPLMVCLSDRQDLFRHIAAATALGQIGRPAMPCLIEAAKVGTGDAKRGAISALGCIKEAEAVETLQEVMKEWQGTTLRTGEGLFRDAESLIREHRLLDRHPNAEDRQKESQRLWDDAQALRTRFSEHIESSRWSTPVDIAHALASGAGNELKRLKRVKQPEVK